MGYNPNTSICVAIFRAGLIPSLENFFLSPTMRLFVSLFVLAVLCNCFAIPIPSGHPGSSRLSNLFPCSYNGCEKSFSRRGARATHERIHTHIGPFPCTRCGKPCDSPTGRTIHEKTHDDTAETFHCSVCGKPCKSQGGRTIHEKSHINSFRCRHGGCEQNFTEKTEWKAHEKTHSELWLPVVLNDNSSLHSTKSQDVYNM